MLHLKKKNEYRQNGANGRAGQPVFVYWVDGTPEELAQFKAIQEARKSNITGRSYYITDQSPLWNGQINVNFGKPVFQSFNGPLHENCELLINDNGQGNATIVANPTQDPPTNTLMEREWVRTNLLLETERARAIAQQEALEQMEARKVASANRRNAWGAALSKPSVTPEQVAQLPFSIDTVQLMRKVGTPIQVEDLLKSHKMIVQLNPTTKLEELVAEPVAAPPAADATKK